HGPTSRPAGPHVPGRRPRQTKCPGHRPCAAPISLPYGRPYVSVISLVPSGWPMLVARLPRVGAVSEGFSEGLTAPSAADGGTRVRGRRPCPVGNDVPSCPAGHGVRPPPAGGPPIRRTRAPAVRPLSPIRNRLESRPI